MSRKLKMTTLQDVKTEEVRFLFKPYIAYGKITIAQGDGGAGKTNAILAVAAAVTTGAALPNGSKTEPANVIFQSAEDGYADTIKPRLERLGADCSRIHIIGEDEQALVLSDERIEQAIVQTGAKLLVLDPLQAFIGCANMNSTNGMRPLMKALGAVADRTGCAVVIIGHLNKNGVKAAYRGLGSIDIIAAARSVLTFGRLDEDEHIGAFVQTKSNLAPKGSPQAYKLDPIEGFIWLGDCDITIDALLSNKKQQPTSQYDKACRFIESALASGSVPAVDVQQMVMERGVSKKTMQRAKEDLGVVSSKRGNQWYWELPGGESDDDDSQDNITTLPHDDDGTDETSASEPVESLFESAEPDVNLGLASAPLGAAAIAIKPLAIGNRRYLGCKQKLLDFIRTTVDTHCTGVESFADLFGGTGAVADVFRDKNLITNDLLFSNYICHLAWFSPQPYSTDKVEKLIAQYNGIPEPDDNYMSETFAETYFSRFDCKRIGFIREDIERHFADGELNERERALLITSLLYAADKIANTCGHYGAYRQNRQFDKHLELYVPQTADDLNSNNECFNENANQLAKHITADLVYLDPPYNHKQYAGYYHVLENIARWEKPDVFGVACKYDTTGQKSDYCKANAALAAFEELINSISARYILLSYSDSEDNIIVSASDKM